MIHGYIIVWCLQTDGYKHFNRPHAETGRLTKHCCIYVNRKVVSWIELLCPDELSSTWRCSIFRYILFTRISQGWGMCWHPWWERCHQLSYRNNSLSWRDSFTHTHTLTHKHPHTYTPTHTHTHAGKYTHVHTHTHTHTLIHTSTHTYTHTHTHPRTHIHTYTHTPTKTKN